MWSFPDAFMVVKSFWFSWLDPNSRKQTNPSWVRKSLASVFVIVFIVNHLYLYIIHQSKPRILLDFRLELFCKRAVISDVLLQPSHSKVSDDKPEFQWSKAPAQRDSPVLRDKCLLIKADCVVVKLLCSRLQTLSSCAAGTEGPQQEPEWACSGPWPFIRQREIRRSTLKPELLVKHQIEPSLCLYFLHWLSSINSPHSAAVKIDKHPLVGVHVKGLGKLNSLHQGAELRADEGAASIACVNMKPGSKFLYGCSLISNN